MIIFRSLDLSSFDHCMFWAACNLAYFGFLRSAEFTVLNLASFSPALHLSVSDISVDSDANPSFLRVRIKASKTDPFQEGCFVHIGRGRFPLCALQAVLAYLALRGNLGGPPFLFQDGRPLTRAVLTARLREILAGVGVSGNFCSHSFRIGAAMVAARNGVPDHLIQALGHWCSSAYQLYICTLFSSRCWLSWLVTRVYVGIHADRRKSSGPVLLSFSGSLAACLCLPAVSARAPLFNREVHGSSRVQFLHQAEPSSCLAAGGAVADLALVPPFHLASVSGLLSLIS